MHGQYKVKIFKIRFNIILIFIYFSFPAPYYIYY
jgi:hypothetical protein